MKQANISVDKVIIKHLILFRNYEVNNFWISQENITAIKAMLRYTFSECVYYMQFQFQSNNTWLPQTIQRNYFDNARNDIKLFRVVFWRSEICLVILNSKLWLAIIFFSNISLDLMNSC